MKIPWRLLLDFHYFLDLKLGYITPLIVFLPTQYLLIFNSEFSQDNITEMFAVDILFTVLLPFGLPLFYCRSFR